MLGSGESVEALLDILAHDSTMQIRERAANGLSQSGLLTGEQRLTAIPQLLNLLDDDSLNAATRNLVSSTLEAITGASFGKNTAAWRDWWAQHDNPAGKSHRMPKNLITA
jgi:prophage DNA circulation protein